MKSFAQLLVLHDAVSGKSANQLLRKVQSLKQKGKRVLARFGMNESRMELFFWTHWQRRRKEKPEKELSEKVVFWGDELE